jgi:CheY-like chemotaxis protein
VTHKLLLADASVTIQRVVELTFAGADVHVVSVGDGEEAIATIPRERPDIIVADIAMPKRSGYDVAAFVKGCPDLSHIPVLLMAGAFEPVDETRAKEVHSDGVVVKPFEPQQLVVRVRDLLERKAPVLESDERTAASELDDYFNRLEAAFAELGSTMNRRPAPRSSDRDQHDGGEVPTLESVLAVSPATGDANSSSRAGLAAGELPGHEAGRPRSATPNSESGGDATSGRDIVAEMFTALFAAEQGESLAPPTAFQAPQTQTPALVTDALVDEVTRQVIERLAPGAANEFVARIVSEVAERLIREEISRVKAAAAARGESIS